MAETVIDGILETLVVKAISEPNLYYPIDILSVKDRPLLRLTCMVPQSGYTNIYFPMPEGVQMNDSMSYNNQDLNILGYAAQRGTKVMLESGSAAEGLGRGAAEVKNILGQFIPTTREQAMTTASQALTDNAEINAGIASVTQMTQNKNTITTFDGVSIRTHSFSFKMIARSPEESEMIKKIQFAFRSGMYPVNEKGAENMRLRFPPKWQIRYISSDMKDLKYLPQPYDCYLQNLSTNFNASSKMWRNDKAPLEVDITVAFMETKALTMKDIADLQYGFSADGVSGTEISYERVKEFANKLKTATGIDKLNASLNSPGAEGQVGIGGINYTGPGSKFAKDAIEAFTLRAK